MLIYVYAELETNRENALIVVKRYYNGYKRLYGIEL